MPDVFDCENLCSGAPNPRRLALFGSCSAEDEFDDAAGREVGEDHSLVIGHPADYKEIELTAESASALVKPKWLGIPTRLFGLYDAN